MALNEGCSMSAGSSSLRDSVTMTSSASHEAWSLCGERFFTAAPPSLPCWGAILALGPCPELYIKPCPSGRPRGSKQAIYLGSFGTISSRPMRHEGCLPDLPYYVVIVETSHDCCKLHTGTLYHQCINRIPRALLDPWSVATVAPIRYFTVYRTGAMMGLGPIPRWV